MAVDNNRLVVHVWVSITVDSSTVGRGHKLLSPEFYRWDDAMAWLNTTVELLSPFQTLLGAEIIPVMSDGPKLMDLNPKL